MTCHIVTFVNSILIREVIQCVLRQRKDEYIQSAVDLGNAKEETFLTLECYYFPVSILLNSFARTLLFDILPDVELSSTYIVEIVIYRRMQPFVNQNTTSI